MRVLDDKHPSVMHCLDMQIVNVYDPFIATFDKCVNDQLIKNAELVYLDLSC